MTDLESNELTIATDGSCLDFTHTGWAYYAEDGRSAYGGHLDGTNNIGELLAVFNVFLDFPDTPLVIQSDSAYTIGASVTWVDNWAANGWKNSKKEIVANLDIIQQIYGLTRDRIARDVPFRFQKVKAHLTDLSVWPLNVRADELAGLASARAANGLTEIVRTDKD